MGFLHSCDFNKAEELCSAHTVCIMCISVKTSPSESRGNALIPLFPPVHFQISNMSTKDENYALRKTCICMQMRRVIFFFFFWQMHRRGTII